MHYQFDATLKDLLEEFLPDYRAAIRDQFGLALGGAVRAIDADVSTISASADKVCLIEGPPRLLLDLEPQSGPDAELPQRLLKYSVLLTDRHKLRVRTVVLLLRPKADGPHVTGTLRYQFEDDEDSYLTFRYHVLRVWQLPVETVLAGGMGLLPLAPLTAVPKKQVPAVIARMDERIEREATPRAARKLRAAAKLLLGLRFRRDEASLLMPGAKWMKDSDTYLEILEEGEAKGLVKGRVAEAKRFLLLLGRKQFGIPDRATKAALEAITDPQRLEQLGERVLEASSWQELLAKPGMQKRSRPPNRKS
jgi:predicted transposase YdaD